MKKRPILFRSFAVLMTIMLTFCQLGLTSVFDATATAPYTVVKLSDSAAWDGDIGYMDTVGAVSEINGPSGYAVYKGLNVGNEIVQFKAKLNLDTNDGWFGMKFRANAPYNAMWENKQCYFIIIGIGRVEVMKVKDKVSTIISSATSNLNDNKQHEIQAGVYDTAKGATVVFNVDGQSIINFQDTNPVKGSSVFSINLFQPNTKAEITVYSNSTAKIGGIVNRNASSVSKSVITNKNWFINNYVGMAPEQGVIAQLSKSADKITVTGKGSVSYKNYLDAKTVSFDVSLNLISGDKGSTIVLFRKQDRDAFYGDNAYGVRVSKNGRVSLVRYMANKAKVFPSVETGIDFSKPKTISVEVVDNGDFSANIFIYVNSKTKAYKYVDDIYNPNLEPPGSMGVVNSDYNVISTVGNIKYSGNEIEYTSENTQVKPVYFADYMVESGNKFLHFVYRPDYANYLKAEISDINGKKIGETNFPNNTYLLPKNHRYTILYITAVNIDGNKSDRVLVDLKEKRSDYYASKVEKIIIKSGSTKAGFYTKDSNKEFVMNGVNYVGLRFGDHATFEPQFDLIPANYDPLTVDTMMKELKKNGFNSVRVFVMGGRSTQNHGLGGIVDKTQGLYIPYLENIVDFIKRAAKYGVYVMPNFGENEMISNDYFKTLSNNSNVQMILFSKEGLNAKKQYLKLFLEYIKERDPSLLNSIIALQMQNEFSFSAELAPFDKTTGTYKFLDGTTYDLSSNVQRRVLANVAIKNYYKEMKQAITSVVPDMLLSEGTFSMLAVDKNYDDNKGITLTKGDNRYPMTAVEYLETDIDFLDMHVYRYRKAGNAQQVFIKNFNNMQLNTTRAKELLKNKPIILGEYGSMSNDYTEQTFDAGMNFAIGLRENAILKGFSGALMWTIDSFQQTGIWALADQNGRYFKKVSLLAPQFVSPNEKIVNEIKAQNISNNLNKNDAISTDFDINKTMQKKSLFSPILIPVLVLSSLCIGLFILIKKKYKKDKKPRV